MSESFSETLELELAPYWERLKATRIYRTLMGDESLDLDLLRLYLLESYHYVKHNAQHQAMVVWRTDVRDRDYMKKALRHAYEEVDHDQLALNDLVKLGVSREGAERSIPLPQTAAFTGYLYYEVTRHNPIGRLGYSIWAEGANTMIREVVAAIKKKFGVNDDKSLSFFVAHAVLDQKHHAEARESIDRFVRTPDDRESVRRVAFTTFELFLGMLEAIYDRSLQLKHGAPLLQEAFEPKLRGQTPAFL